MHWLILPLGILSLVFTYHVAQVRALNQFNEQLEEAVRRAKEIKELLEKSAENEKLLTDEDRDLLKKTIEEMIAKNKGI